MLGDSIRQIRKKRKISINTLSKTSGVSLGYLSDLENSKVNNPTTETLQKIACALDVYISDFFIDTNEPSHEKMTEEDNKQERKKQLSSADEIEFNTPEAAMQFILKQPAIMGFGGFDANKMSDQEVMEFANELLNQLKLLGFKYKK